MHKIKTEVLTGCPDPAYYGIDCSKPCPDPNCQYCHIKTGTCLGCKPGYRGHGCKLGMPSLNFLNILLIIHDLCACACVNACMDVHASERSGAYASVFEFTFREIELIENARVPDPYKSYTSL